MPRARRQSKPAQADSYDHPESTVLLRPDVGTQAQFKKKKPPQRYRFDSSLSPALDWDGQNAAREQGERQLALLRAKVEELRRRLAEAEGKPEADDLLDQIDEAVRQLVALSRPFLNWAGKAERLSFDVPTLPLFVHERLSTKAIIETLTGHRKSKEVQS